MNNLINIFDGSQTDLTLIGTFAFELEGSFSEDLYSRKNLRVNIFEEDKVINNLDVFHAKIFDRIIIGRVEQIERDETGKTNLSLSFGINVFNTFINIPKNVLNGYNLSESLGSPLELMASSNDDIIATDTDLELDVLLRQSCRKSPKKIEMSFAEDIEKSKEKLSIKVTDIIQEEYNIKLNELLEVNEKYGNDSFTMVTLKDGADPTNYKNYYMYENREIGENIDLAKKPIKTSKVRKVLAENINIEFAKSIFKEQEYDNEITFTIPIENDFIALQYDDTFLGRVLNVYSTRIDGPFKTIISKYDIVGEMITVTLGLSRSNITGKLNKQREVLR